MSRTVWVLGGIFGLQEDMARILVKEHAGDLDGAREVAQAAVARSRDQRGEVLAGWFPGAARLHRNLRS